MMVLGASERKPVPNIFNNKESNHLTNWEDQMGSLGLGVVQLSGTTIQLFGVIFGAMSLKIVFICGRGIFAARS